MLILGIDPGLANCGWGIIEASQEAKNLRLVSCGVLKTQKSDGKRGLRLSLIKQEIDQLLLKYQPQEAAIEDLFFFKNKKTAFAVSQTHGVITLGLEEAGIPVYNYTPLHIKLALTGYGKATKKQIQYMTQKFLNLSENPRPAHSADALAVALTHLFQRKLKN